MAQAPGLPILCREGIQTNVFHKYKILIKVLECYDWCTGQWSVLTEKPDWVFGAELAAADGRLFTLGGVASR